MMRLVFALFLVGSVTLCGCDGGPQMRSDGDSAIAEIRLSSGEPTGTEPFVVLDSLRQKYPDARCYSVNYTTPVSQDEEHLSYYEWKPSEQSLTFMEGTSSGFVSTLWPMGLVTAMDAETVHAVATGAEPTPQYLWRVTLAYTDQEIAEFGRLEADELVRAYFASGHPGVESALSAPFVQTDRETDPAATDSSERMWGIDDLRVTSVGDARLPGVDAAQWKDQREFRVTYTSRAPGSDGEPPGPRAYSVVIGRQSATSPWRVLDLRNANGQPG